MTALLKHLLHPNAVWCTQDVAVRMENGYRCWDQDGRHIHGHPREFLRLVESKPKPSLLGEAVVTCHDGTVILADLFVHSQFGRKHELRLRYEADELEADL